MDRSGRNRAACPMDPGVLECGRALRDRGGVCQPPRRGRGDADQGCLWRPLRPAGRAKEQIRPDKPVPAEPEHQANSVSARVLATVTRRQTQMSDTVNDLLDEE